LEPKTELRILNYLKANLNPLAAHQDSRKFWKTSHSFDIANMNNQRSSHDYLKSELPMFEFYI